MADHPLRPATDRRLGRPLPHQLANQTQNPLLAPGLAVPRFHHRHPSPWSHAVLPLLSERYSPQRGRFSTRYSPVCHAPCGHIRLACVRHAASVHSEPGSNSHVQYLKLSGPSPRGAEHVVRLVSLQSLAGLKAFPFSLSGFQRRPDDHGLPSRARPLSFRFRNLDRGRQSDYHRVGKSSNILFGEWLKFF